MLQYIVKRLLGLVPTLLKAWLLGVLKLGNPFIMTVPIPK